MRIVGGIYKGRKLVEFKGYDVRPTSDMVRESLFNILRDKVRGATFLDLFCGTGAMGIEALSRGAKKIVFNDVDRESLRILNENLSKIGITENFTVSKNNALDFLDYARETFDLVYVDPPYASDLGEQSLNKVCEVLAKDGIAILESERFFDKEIAGLNKYDQRKYGRACLTFFKRSE